MRWYKMALTGRQFSSGGGKFGVIETVDSSLNRVHPLRGIALFGPAIVLPTALEYGLYLMVADSPGKMFEKRLFSALKAFPCEAPATFGLSFWWGDRKFDALML